jgi:hypothetical protein
MSLGNIGKALAGQAFEATKKNVIDAIAGPEPGKPAAQATAPAAPESIGGVILGQIQAMQRPLKDDHELVVLFHTGAEMLRVTEIFVPSLQVFVLAGLDASGNITRAVVPAEQARVVCKIVKVAEGARPVRVNVLSPRPRPETTT